jgi:hypothetical protein
MPTGPKGQKRPAPLMRATLASSISSSSHFGRAAWRTAFAGSLW